MIFKRNKAKSTPTENGTCEKGKRGHLDLGIRLSNGFKVKSGVKSGAIDFSRFSLDSLSHSKGTLDDTLKSDIFV